MTWLGTGDYDITKQKPQKSISCHVYKKKPNNLILTYAIKEQTIKCFQQIVFTCQNKDHN